MKAFLGIVLLLFAPVLLPSQIGGWTGRLIDAGCHRRHPARACPASASTTEYAVLVPGGTVFPIAAASAPQVRKLVQGEPRELTVVVAGRLKAGAIDVERITVTSATMAAAPERAAAPSHCDLRLPDGGCYEITVPKNAHIQRARGRRRVVITGTLEGNTIRAESITIE